MDKMNMIKQASAKARAEFRQRVAGTGLEIAMDYGGSVLITGWGNAEKDVAETLDKAGLEWQPTGTGAYTASAFPLIKNAVCEQLQKPELTIA